MLSVIFCEEEDETFDHIFHDCLVFWVLRREASIVSNKEGRKPVQITKILQIEDAEKATKVNIKKS